MMIALNLVFVAVKVIVTLVLFVQQVLNLKAIAVSLSMSVQVDAARIISVRNKLCAIRIVKVIMTVCIHHVVVTVIVHKI